MRALLLTLLLGCSTATSPTATPPLAVGSAEAPAAPSSPAAAKPDWPEETHLRIIRANADGTQEIAALGFVVRFPSGAPGLDLPHRGPVPARIALPAGAVSPPSNEASDTTLDEIRAAVTSEPMVETRITPVIGIVHGTARLVENTSFAHRYEVTTISQLRIVDEQTINAAMGRFAVAIDEAEHNLDVGLAAAIPHLERARAALVERFGDGVEFLEAFHFVDSLLRDVRRASASGEPSTLAACVRQVYPLSRWGDGEISPMGFQPPRYEVDFARRLNALVRDGLHVAFTRERDPARARALAVPLLSADAYAQPAQFVPADVLAARRQSRIVAEVRRRFPDLPTAR